MTELSREIENAVWEIGPEKFARKGHQRCINPGQRTSSGIAYVWMGTGITATGPIDQNAMNICTCVRAHVRKHGLRIITRRGAR